MSMNTSDNLWKENAYISKTSVVQKQSGRRSSVKHLTKILRADKVQFNPIPVEIGTKLEKIQIKPILKDGKIVALHVICPCGCDSTFDIQYAAKGESQ